MALESGTYVKDLVITNPPGTDAISQGDDHIRLIKTVLKNSFPSNSSAPILPDIAGNGDKYLQVNSGATATQWVALDVNALTRRKGEVASRAKFEYASTTSITVNPGIYDLSNKGQNVSWDAALTVTGLSGTSQWVYIYLDESAITAGVDVTANEIIGSTTAPTYSAGKHAWYNGEDRCIFAVYFNGSSQIEKFHHNGGDYVFYADDNEELALAQPTFNAWTNVTVSKVPAFTSEVELTWRVKSDATETDNMRVTWRVDGDSGLGHHVATVEAGSGSFDDEHVTANIRTFLGASDIIEYYANSSGTGHKIAIYSNGFYLPNGL